MSEQPTDDPRSAFDGVEVTPEAVAVVLGRAYWRVEDCRWQSVRPDLAEHLAALLAPPIVVSAAPVRDRAAASPTSRK